jgi:hypothetical protein
VFHYRIFTQDWVGHDPNHPQYDYFGAYAGGMDDAHPHFYDGNTDEKKVGCFGSINDLDWRTHSIDLSDYRGQQVTIYFANWNGVHPVFDTYTYLDDVAVVTPPSGP